MLDVELFLKGMKMNSLLISGLDKFSAFIVAIIRKLNSKKSKLNEWLIMLLFNLLKNVIVLNEKLTRKEVYKTLTKLQNY
jgi:fructose-1,6-bisphosphatase